MFSFQNLDVYVRSKAVNHLVHKLCQGIPDIYMTSQLRRATLSITLNIAEGAGRLTSRDKRHYYVISRGSAFESVSIIELLFEQNQIEEQDFLELYEEYEDISKMLYRLIESYSFSKKKY